MPKRSRKARGAGPPYSSSRNSITGPSILMLMPSAPASTISNVETSRKDRQRRQGRRGAVRCGEVLDQIVGDRLEILGPGRFFEVAGDLARVAVDADLDVDRHFAQKGD